MRRYGWMGGVLMCTGIGGAVIALYAFHETRGPLGCWWVGAAMVVAMIGAAIGMTDDGPDGSVL